MFGALFDQGDEDGEDGETKTTTTSTSACHLNAPPPPRSSSDFVGLDNQGATCYMNSLLQTWFMTPEIRKAMYSLSPEKVLNVAHIKATQEESLKLKRKAPRKVILHLQKLFTQLQFTAQRSVSTSELTNEGFGWKDGDARIQHDLDALYNELVDAVNKSLVKTDVDNLTRQLFQVHTSKSVETITDPVYISKSFDQAFSLQIPTIKGVSNLTSALNNYFQREHLDDGNPIYKVDEESDHPFAGKKVAADTVCKLESSPPILLVSINRMHFDMQTFKTSKVKDRFDSPLVLDMRPYFSNSPVVREEETKKGTKTAWNGPEEKEEKTPLSETKTKSINVWPDDLITEEGEATAMSASESVSNEKYVYDLFAVVIHHGNSANSGHYTSYIRDTLHEGNWTPPEYKVQKKNNNSKHGQNEKKKGNSTFGSEMNEQRYSPQSPLITIVSILLNCNRDPYSKLHSCEMGRMGGLIKQKTGDKYAKKFPKSKWPALQSFCSQNSDFFKISGGKVMLHRDKEKCIPDIEYEWKKIQIANRVRIAQNAQEKNNSKDGCQNNDSSDSEMTDEEKSLALIAKLQADDKKKSMNNNSTNRSKNNNNGWQEVTSKKLNRKHHDTNNKSNNNANETKESKEKDVETREAAAAAAEAAAATKYYEREKRLADNWGHWFWFNDHRVVPISISDVAHAAVGKDSSRMLIYRSRSLNTNKNDSKKTDLIPPSFWYNQVVDHNKDLKMERETYDKAVNTVEIFLHTPNMYKIHKSNCCLERLSKLTNNVEVDSDDNNSVEKSANELKVTIDVRSTIGEFKALVLTELTKRSQANNILINMSEPFILSEVLPAGPPKGFHLFRTIGGGLDEKNEGKSEGKKQEGKDGNRTNEGETKKQSKKFISKKTPMSWAAVTAGKPLSTEELDKKLLSDKTYGISSGATLLAWNGIKLHDTPYNSGAENTPIHIHLVKLAPKTKELGGKGGNDFVVTKECDTYIPKSYTYVEALTTISDICSIQVDEIGVHRIESLYGLKNSKGGKPKPHTRISAELSAIKTLESLKITNGTILCVEKEDNVAKQKKGYHPLASRYAHSKANEMSFNIIDLIEPTLKENPQNDIPETSISITVNMNDTILSVKNHIISKLSIETQHYLKSQYELKRGEFDQEAEAAAVATKNNESKNNNTSPLQSHSTDLTCRLRFHSPAEESIPFGDAIPAGPRQLIQDESKLMKDLRGISKGDTFYVELGRPLPKHYIAIRFFVVIGNLQTHAGGRGKRDSVEHWLYIHKNSSTNTALHSMCNQLGISKDKYRLRQVEGGDSGKLCTEIEKSITEYASHGDTLLLEEGKIPLKGVITLNLHLFVTPEERVALDEWTKNNEDLSTSKESSNRHNDEELAKVAEDVDCPSKDEQNSLKTVTEDAFTKSRRKKSECIYHLKPLDVNKNSITIFQLRGIISQQAAVQHLAQIRGIELTNPKQLRIRELDKQCVPRKVYSDNSKSLIKCKGIQFKNLVIQLLPEPEQLSPNDILFFVQHRNLQTKENTPDWPCQEIIFKAGPSPKLGAIEKIFLSTEGDTLGPAAAYTITKENLIIAKFFTKSLVWRQFNNLPPNNQKRGKGRGKRNNRQVNLKSKYQLNDGDLLAFADASLCGTTKREDIDFLREEDEVAQQYKELALIAKKNKKNGGSNSGGGSSAKVKRAAPVGDAKIHVYLGFSSDEDDDEEVLPT